MAEITPTIGPATQPLLLPEEGDGDGDDGDDGDCDGDDSDDSDDGDDGDDGDDDSVSIEELVEPSLYVLI